MKKGLFLVIGGAILVGSICLLSYKSYDFFTQEESPVVEVNTLEIVLDDQGKVNLSDQNPISDNESNTITPYKFSVKNLGKTQASYELLIEDFVTDEKTELLNRKYLNYELKLNDQVIKIDNLSNVQNNIIDTQSLSAGGENKYEFRIWIVADTSNNDWMGKTYNYNISVNPKPE